MEADQFYIELSVSLRFRGELDQRNLNNKRLHYLHFKGYGVRCSTPCDTNRCGLVCCNKRIDNLSSSNEDRRRFQELGVEVIIAE